jgi:hypothetical protein
MPRIYIPGMTTSSHEAIKNRPHVTSDYPITNDDVALNAAIAKSKLNLTGAIVNSDIADGTIDLTKKATYVPVNKAGDTITGTLDIQNIRHLARKIEWQYLDNSTCGIGWWDGFFFRWDVNANITAVRPFDTDITLLTGRKVDGVDISDHVHDGSAGNGPKVKGIDPSIIQAGSNTLDASGVKTVTFPTAFPTGVTPKIFVSSQDAANSGVILDVTAKSNTGFTVKARKVTGITSGSAGSHNHLILSGVNTGTPTPVGTWQNAGDGQTVNIIHSGGFSGTTRYSSTDGAHTHSVNAPAAPSINFDWLAVNL